MVIRLTRGHGFEMGTFGVLTMPSGFECVTLERPWDGNRRSLSCIPAGVYTMGTRRSEVVRRASNGRRGKGWEVQDVPGRSFIMIHPGNSIEDTEGCILPGAKFSGWQVSGEPRWTVSHSQHTFQKLMLEMDESDQWTIDIRYFMPEYP